MTTPLKQTCDSIIFDLDGTLWDSTPSVTTALQLAANEYGYTPGAITEDRVRATTGMTYHATFIALFPDLDEDQINEIKRLYTPREREIVYTRGGLLYPAVRETLQELATRYKLYIVSNCSAGYIEMFLDLNNLHTRFQGHQCFGTKGQPKADNIRDVIKDHSLKAPVYVGDTALDYTSATAAGIPFIFAAYGFGKATADMPYTINQPADLCALL